MKTLSKRTKTILAIVAGVIVLAAIVLIVFQPPMDTLFGATVLQITPHQSVFTEKQTVALQMANGVGCTWSKSNNNIEFVNNVNTGNPVSMCGLLAGTTNVIANCVGRTGIGSVTINRPPTATPKPPLTIDPLNPRIHPDHYEYQYTQLLKAVNAATDCTWSVSDSRMGWALVNGGYQIYIPHTHQAKI